MSNQFMIKYKLGNSFFETLSGKTKVRLFLVSIILLMISFDLRLILPSFILNLIIFLSIYKEDNTLKFIFKFAIIMNLLNLILFYIVNPVTGTELVGTKTIIYSINDYYVITYETIIYFITRLLKIFGVLITSLWFVLSITPSQLGSGLNACGIPYKICTMISLAFRYLPDIHRDFNTIKDSMQMRGLELDAKKSNIITRLKNNIKILLPLILISFDRVDTISSAMDLRGYGQGRKRSYYSDIKPTKKDKIINFLTIFQIIVIIVYMYLKIINKVPELWIF